MHILPACRVAKQSVVLSGGDALRSQLVEQAFVDTERPFFAPVWSAILVVQVTEMVPKMFRERSLGELDGDRQNAGFVDQIQPMVPVVLAIAADTVIHKQNRCPDVVIVWPRGMKHQRTVPEGSLSSNGSAFS